MVDNTNPTNQFHPYQPVTDTPVSERPQRGLGDSLKNISVNDAIGKVRGFARSNPGVVLGGLAALAIGLGLMRRRLF